MRVNRMLTVGFLALMAGFGMLNVSDSFAAAVHRVDVIENSNETVAQLDSKKEGDHGTRVDVIGSIGSEGPAYPYLKPINR